MWGKNCLLYLKFPLKILLSKCLIMALGSISHFFRVSGILKRTFFPAWKQFDSGSIFFPSIFRFLSWKSERPELSYFVEPERNRPEDPRAQLVLSLSLSHRTHTLTHWHCLSPTRTHSHYLSLFPSQTHITSTHTQTPFSEPDVYRISCGRFLGVAALAVKSNT